MFKFVSCLFNAYIYIKSSCVINFQYKVYIVTKLNNIHKVKSVVRSDIAAAGFVSALRAYLYVKYLSKSTSSKLHKRWNISSSSSSL